jgi:hypothetical protein
MTRVPTIPTKASAGQIADILEDTYGCPRDLLERLAAEVAADVVFRATTAVRLLVEEWIGSDWLGQ